MTLQLTRRGLVATCAALAAMSLAGALYLTNLTVMGMVSTDEPRYAAIGREMALSGDWITPRLWGQPWFEKPPLLYWMIAAGFRLGLGPDLAPRLPIALCSLAFLVFFWFRLRDLWDERVASCATALLATCGGWLACSHVAITDIPMAILFSSAVLLAIGHEPRRLTRIGAILGCATLAKSLVPLVLFLPVLAVDYRRWRDWLRPGPLLAFALTSLPWHILSLSRNGGGFLRVLFLEQQFGRFTSPDLQHGQHWWYYIPVLSMLLYPWFPLVVVIPRDWGDRRVRTLISVVVFGLVFFSATINKLPAYPLPLVPCICALMGAGLARSRRPNWLVAVPVALLGLLPLAARILPGALATGLRSVPVPSAVVLIWLAASVVVALAVGALPRRNSVYFAVALTGFSLLWLQFRVFPDIDGVVSARPLWYSRHPDCASNLHRRIQYGLNYYAGRELPPCDILDQSGVPAAAGKTR